MKISNSRVITKNLEWKWLFKQKTNSKKKINKIINKIKMMSLKIRPIDKHLYLLKS